jgi:hypothetical protein
MADAGNINRNMKARNQSLSTILMFIICIACGNKESICPDSTCGDYATQAAAQAAYNADPSCNKKLDPNNDGAACEQHFNTGNNGTGGTGNGGNNSGGSGTGSNGGTGGNTSACPTTANCGCSNKNKDACASACCKWVVGSGCQCK